MILGGFGGTLGRNLADMENVPCFIQFHNIFQVVNVLLCFCSAQFDFNLVKYTQMVIFLVLPTTMLGHVLSEMIPRNAHGF